MTSAGVECAVLACETVPAAEFNRQVQAMGNKASVNLCCVMRRLDGLWRRFAQDELEVIVDRLGGRVHYLRSLQLCFADAMIRVVTEQPAHSRYQLRRGGSVMTVSFLQEAEGRHLPVALASMVAKYVRELLMIRMNDYFRGHLPGLRPTAGYFGDARRYLTEIKPVIDRLRLPASQLVRTV